MITLNAGRTVEQKTRVVELLNEDPGVHPQGVLINPVEVPRETWSFGVAQHAS